MLYKKTPKRIYPTNSSQPLLPGRLRSGRKGKGGLGIGKKKSPSIKSKSVAKSVMNTKKWGKISHPKGSNPIVIEVKTGGTSQLIEGLGISKNADKSVIQNELAVLQKALEKKCGDELRKDQKAEILIHFPKSRRKPFSFSAVGHQPITAPVIYNPGWTPPDAIVKDIKAEMLKNPNRKTASDLEAMAYLSTASQAAPITEQYARIYFYTARNYLRTKGYKNKKFGKGIEFLDENKSLRPDDQRELRRLKDWIFRQQQKVLCERKKGRSSWRIKNND